MRLAGRIGFGYLLLSPLVVCPTPAMAQAAAQTRQALTAELWPPERIEAALLAIEAQRTAGILSEADYQRRREMLNRRLDGTFTPTMLSVVDSPDLLQNGGFEQVNRNTRPHQSRWLWWQGWRWEGEYENSWEDRRQHVRSGRYSARVTATGASGRIAIFTPVLPPIEGATEYVFSVWAKGEGANELFLRFEAGVRGELRKRIGSEWERVTLTGHAGSGGRGYRVYLNVTGEGTIWFDDAELKPGALP
jgi:hypothetical protein